MGVRRLAGVTALVMYVAAPAWAQVPAFSASVAAARVTVTARAGEPLVSAGPGAIGCRTLITEIARQAHLTVRNLATVPDDVVFVQIRDASLPDAVASALRLAKVDYVLREGAAGGPPSLLLIAGRRSGGLTAGPAGPAGGTPSSPAIEGGPPTSVAPTPVELPAVEVADEDASPAAVPLDVHPEVIEIGPAPTWQAIDAAPAPVALPADMVPTPFAVTAPPAPAAPVGMPSPPPARAPSAMPRVTPTPAPPPR